MNNRSKDMQIDIVSELYALRAGLSAVSKNIDDVRSKKGEISHENERIKVMENEIEAKNREIDMCTDKANQLIQNNENIENNIKQEINQEFLRIIKENHNAKSRSDYIISGAAVVIFLIGLGISFVIIWMVSLLVSGSDPASKLSYLYTFIGAPLIIGPIANFFVRRSKCKIYEKQAEDEVKRKISSNHATISNIMNEISEKKDEIRDIDIVYKDICNECQSKISDINKVIDEKLQLSALLNTALENKYSGLLNPADWKNTDLCIFYLETGRADTIKECLQLADRQRQSDEIVGAIKQAANKISSEINRGITALGTTMVTCLNALSDQIDSICKSFEMQHSETIRALDSINSISENVLSATQLSNALQEKANESIESLYSDYKYVQNNFGFF